MANYYNDFVVYYADLDHTFQASVAALQRYSEETAIAHNESKGYGLAYTYQSSRAFFQLKSLLFVAQQPLYRQKLRCETWLTGINASHSQCGRAYHLYDEQGQTIALRNSLWLFTNTKARSPAPISKEIMQSFSQKPSLLTTPFSKFLAYDAPIIASSTFTLLPSHIDSNGYVNNTLYITFVQDSLPSLLTNTMALFFVESHFMVELKLGDTFRLTTQQLANNPYPAVNGYELLFKSAVAYRHTFTNQHNIQVATLCTLYSPLTN
jgi:acyl-ACP thioesterase